MLSRLFVSALSARSELGCIRRNGQITDFAEYLAGFPAVSRISRIYLQPATMASTGERKFWQVSR